MAGGRSLRGTSAGRIACHAGEVTPRILLLITFGIGLCTAVTSPAWQAILPALVPRSDL
ncbi:MAG: hypothetical protein EOP93_21910, partial [Lysobacteraceae bacterium]